jgi:hypothetical protein
MSTVDCSFDSEDPGQETTNLESTDVEAAEQRHQAVAWLIALFGVEKGVEAKAVEGLN